jgi:hypothetical protein
MPTRELTAWSGHYRARADPARMRVTIEYREESAGITGAKRHYYVDCEVLFSEEEKAIITARGLPRQTFTVDPAVPPPEPVQYISATALRRGAWLLLPISFVIGVGFNGPLGDTLAMVAIGGFVAAFVMRRKVAIAEVPTQIISFQQLLDFLRFTIFASDPARAKNLDSALRAKLAGLKMLLLESTDIPIRETFEL